MKYSLDWVALAIIIGILPLLLLPDIPSFLLLGGAALLAIAGLRWRRSRFFALCLCGFIWASSQANLLLNQITTFSQGTVTAVATMKSVALVPIGAAQPVVLQLQQINGVGVFPPIAFSTEWGNDSQTPFCAGQTWQLRVRLRPVHSRLNLGTFDGQRWAVANRQPLTGTILQAQPLSITCSWRQQIITYIDKQIKEYQYRDVLIALAFGERALLDRALRQQFLHTGIAHLVAISGLHIAVAAMLAWGIVRSAQFFLPVRYISYRMPLIAGWIVAVTYAWLAGGNPPVIRAVLALTLWTLLRLSAVRCTAWQVWLWCVALILLNDPLAILSDSFWLSCSAVGALIFWFIWAPLAKNYRQHWYWAPLRWLHLQGGIVLLLLPVQVVLFQGVALTALPANLWAVPIVSLFAVPLILLALLLSSWPLLNAPLWYLADLSLQWAFAPLSYLQQGWVVLQSTWLPLSLSGFLAILIWRFQWWRHHVAAVTVLFLSLLLMRQSTPQYRWRVDMLDVGHGLAVLIERHGHTMIYDTGDRWQGGSMAESVILPHLNWRGLTLEQMMISHSHQDHIGGLEILHQAFPDATVRTPLLNMGHLPCQQEQEWYWQGLHFQVLWPHQRVEYAGNNDSCVIRVDDGRYSLLLTGDLEAQAELQLVREQRDKLRSTVLQVPHHGSNTSSSAPFLRAVRPEIALASAPRFSPWHFPSVKVVKRYAENHLLWRDTAHSGQLSVFFFDNEWQVKGFREDLIPRWYHQWFGVNGDNE